MRKSLFFKYTVYFATLITFMLLISGGVSVYFAYKESRAALLDLQREKAGAAASRIEAYIRDLERQIGWMRISQLGAGTPEQRRIDFLKLLRQAPAVTEVSQLDRFGKEQLRISRLGMDGLASGEDFSASPKFTVARSGKTYFSPVYFRKGTEPYMTISMAGLSEEAGVTAAEVNLKLIWDVISQIRIGEKGLAYVVDGRGRLIAHPDISQVLQQTDLSSLPQVKAAIEESKGVREQVSIARTMQGAEVLAAYSSIQPLEWHVFVEQPSEEAFAPLYASVKRTGLTLLGGIALAVLASLVLARRMLRPIDALRRGAEAIGAGHLDQTIDVRTGDELEDLAGRFNGMAAKLQESYSGLERKVEERTAQLAGEQEKARSLLLNILPEYVIQELTETGAVKPARHEESTVMFTDFAGFTQVTSTMPASRMVTELNTIFAAFDEIAHDAGVEKIKTIGDAYMAAAGLSSDTPDHAQRCVRAAVRMLEYMEERNRTAAFKWQLRIGIHSGPVVSGVVGKRKYAFDIWGDAVNIASRMESSGEPGRVNVSAYTYDLIRSEFNCTYRGKIEAKGKGEIDMYFVSAAISNP